MIVFRKLDIGRTDILDASFGFGRTEAGNSLSSYDLQQIQLARRGIPNMRGNKEKEKSLHIQAAPTMPMPNSTASSFTVFFSLQSHSTYLDLIWPRFFFHHLNGP